VTAQITAGSPNVLINGLSAARQTDTTDGVTEDDATSIASSVAGSVVSSTLGNMQQAIAWGSATLNSVNGVFQMTAPLIVPPFAGSSNTANNMVPTVDLVQQMITGGGVTFPITIGQGGTGANNTANSGNLLVGNGSVFLSTSISGDETLYANGYVKLTSSANTRTNLGLAIVANTGSYNDLSNKPSSLPPSGIAGGDLAGTYPSPSVEFYAGSRLGHPYYNVISEGCPVITPGSWSIYNGGPCSTRGGYLSANTSLLPLSFTIDLGQFYYPSEVVFSTDWPGDDRYLPSAGTIDGSLDNITWSNNIGSWSNTAADPVSVRFAAGPTNCRYLRFNVTGAPLNPSTQVVTSISKLIVLQAGTTGSTQIVMPSGVSSNLAVGCTGNSVGGGAYISIGPGGGTFTIGTNGPAAGAFAVANSSGIRWQMFGNGLIATSSYQGSSNGASFGGNLTVTVPAGDAISLQSTGYSNILGMGMGAANTSDPNAFIINRSTTGGIGFYVNNGASRPINLAANGEIDCGGPLYLSANPTANLQAATKQYVDSQISGGTSPTGTAGGMLSGTYPNPSSNSTALVTFGNVSVANNGSIDGNGFDWRNANGVSQLDMYVNTARLFGTVGANNPTYIWWFDMGTGQTTFPGGATFAGTVGFNGANVVINNATTLSLPTYAGLCSITKGNADAASLTQYDVAFNSWWGIGFPTYSGSNYATLDTRSGSWMLAGDMSSATIHVGGISIYNDAGYLNLAGSWIKASTIVASGSITSNGQIISGGNGGNAVVLNYGTAISSIANATGNLGMMLINSPQPGGVSNTGAASFITFNRSGYYAAYFGLETDNTWRVGGWSMGASSYKIIHEGLTGAANINAGLSFQVGQNWGSTAVSSATDLSRHIALWGTIYGFNVTAGTLNLVSNGSVHSFAGANYTCPGTITASSVTDTSDAKFKENVQDLKEGLNTIRSLIPRTFYNKKTKCEDIGFIAQEVQDVLPEVVKTQTDEEGEYLSLAYGRLTAPIVKALQELDERMQKIEEKLGLN